MDKQFGVKDFFLFLLIIALIISVWMSIKQYDRQWDQIKTISRKLDEHTSELARIQRYAERELAGKLDNQAVNIAKIQGHVEQGVAVNLTLSGQGETSAAEVTASASDQGTDPRPQQSPSTQPESIVTNADSPTFNRLKLAQAKDDYAIGDWVVQDFSSKIPTLTPLVSSDVYARRIHDKVLQTLLARDPDTLEYLPCLATSYELSEDGLQVRFKLRRGVVFSDGEPMDADDVVFSFDFPMNDKIAAPRERAYLEKIDRVEKVNDYEVVFHMKEPYFEVIELTGALYILPKHFYSKFTPEDFNTSTGLLMGTGPYRLESPESWSPSESIVLYRNERYWGEPSPYERCVYRIIENEAASLTMFKNGDIDVYSAVPEQYRDMLKDEELKERATNYEYFNPTSGYVFIAWNQKRDDKKTIFSDKRARQAMTMLTDRHRMCEELMYGYARPSNGPFQPLGKQASPNLKDKTWPFDVEAATKLLNELGWEKKDGVMTHKETGEIFKFKLTYPSKSKTFDGIVLFAKDIYAKAGVVLEPDPVDWPVLIDKLKNQQFDAISLAWSGGFETDIFQMFHSSQTDPDEDNFMNYVNPELDKLMDKARADVNEQTRMPLWHKAHEIIFEDQPYTFLFTRQSLVFIDNRFKNVQRVRAGLNSGGWGRVPCEWYVPKTQQKYSQ